MTAEEFHASMQRIIAAGWLVPIWVDIPGEPVLPAFVAPEHEELFWYAARLPSKPSRWARWWASLCR